MNTEARFSWKKMLQIFQTDSVDEVKEINTNSSNTWCDFDPLPNWPLKKCLDYK